MAALLSPRLWLAIAAAALLAWSHTSAYRLGGNGARADLAEYKALQAEQWRKQADLTTAALIEARARDAQIDRLGRELATTIATNAEDAIHDQQVHQARLARADAAAASLRDQLSTIASAYAGARDKAIAGADAAADLASARAAAGVLADLLGRCDSRAGARAAFADAAHAAGGRCERDYDAARAVGVKADE